MANEIIADVPTDSNVERVKRYSNLLLEYLEEETIELEFVLQSITVISVSAGMAARKKEIFYSVTKEG
ncbi:MAG: hypothetical protein ACPGVE_08175 [Flavobacteriales bacterium]